MLDDIQSVDHILPAFRLDFRVREGGADLLRDHIQGGDELDDGPLSVRFEVVNIPSVGTVGPVPLRGEDSPGAGEGYQLVPIVDFERFKVQTGLEGVVGESQGASGTEVAIREKSGEVFVIFSGQLFPRL